ncbi:YtoQ family protein [Alkalibacillus haloalkaliphilus]|uniref:YtoQ family protein n=1 Tax=Alkalibacillus haloalkaliphilus TaxID=94136 RepID=UPI0029368AE7|nr:YtoQ family protein [Alkalibacillus haloalkaliphilus]MDV2581260.1 YtoQ family protein [Alkalibacillus haloalkaliphilus]
MNLSIYLAGQIHDDWREQLKQKAEQKGLNINFYGPQENHSLSDDIGENVLGKQPNNLYRDDAASGINNFRTELMMQKSDAVIALFGETYKQWNTAMDAGIAIGLNKPLILIRPDSLIHPLKELSNQANVTVETIDQAIDVLAYTFQ